MASSAPPPRIVIGVGAFAVAGNAGSVLSTYALGSCVGLVAYDCALQAGGMLHIMLPDSRISPLKAVAQPAMFADTGLPVFLRELAALGADPWGLRFFLAGGASVIRGQDPFRIGERNIEAVARILAAQGLQASRSDVGGSVNRTLHLDLASGRLAVKTPHSQVEIRLCS